jgi:Cys-rich protein (TIGR01571 family)
MAETQQPKGDWKDLTGSKEFDAGLCSCFDECAVCFYGLICGICMGFDFTKSLDEVPCFTPGALLRQKIRHARGITGSGFADCFVLCCPFTGPCAACQMYRELKLAGKLETCCCGPC